MIERSLSTCFSLAHTLYWMPLCVDVKSGPAFIRALLVSRYDPSPAATGPPDGGGCGGGNGMAAWW